MRGIPPLNKAIPILVIGVVLFIVFGGLYIVYINFSSENPLRPTSIVSEEKIIFGSFDKTKFKSEEEWKKILTPEQYHILREQGTEVPFTGNLDKERRKGTYYSAGCNEPLFRSEQKYDSGTGWPSFWAPIKAESLVLREDHGLLGEVRIEVLDKCGGHLGHVFNDGPQPTGKRYCMNSGALVFVPDEKH